MNWKSVKTVVRTLIAAQMLSGGVLFSILGLNMFRKSSRKEECLGREAVKHAGRLMMLGGLAGVPLGIRFAQHGRTH